ncbi:ABC transporter permease [Sphingomonas sp. RHCKR47]|uniref:ABC transporter permease n=1 Tax=Sphingomonas citricola TaxID=2862498 RepID=UPI001C66DCA8|nr:ABC transporter permease [Sphingomonas citricola]MBW6522802.1 ABC transporter permease [Sphingomonas citricola]
MTAFRRAWSREVEHLRRDPWDLAGITVLPGLLIFVVAALFWQGPLRQIPLGIVDDDAGTAGRAVVRALAASPMIRVEGRYQGEAAAVGAVRAGRIMGFVHIPAGLGDGIARHRGAVLRILYNGSFLTAGGQVASAAEDAVTAALPDIAAERLPNHAVPASRVRRFAVEATLLGNAPISFEWFLGLLIFPAVLHLNAACVCAMALGRELRDTSLSAWARASGGVVPAMVGKMLPYVLAISAWGLVWLLYLTLARGWRVEGSLTLIAGGQALFYAATAAIAALLVAATRETATALSASAVYAGSALAYSGATLPLNGGHAFARIWSNVLPLTHYVALQTGQVSGQALAAAVAPMASLAAYVVVAGGGAAAIVAAAGRRRA